MTRTPPANQNPKQPPEPVTTPWKGVDSPSTPWSGGSTRDRLWLLTQRAEAIERMLAAVPEDAQSPVDGRTREALFGYAQGLRDAVGELSDN